MDRPTKPDPDVRPTPERIKDYLECDSPAIFSPWERELIAEVRALRAELAEARLGQAAAATGTGMVTSLMNDLIESRAQIPEVTALVEAVRQTLRADLTGYTERLLRQAMVPFGGAPPEDETVMGEQACQITALVKAARDVFDAEARFPEKPERQLIALQDALEPFEDWTPLGETSGDKGE